jgi:hypothetical protein
LEQRIHQTAARELELLFVTLQFQAVSGEDASGALELTVMSGWALLKSRCPHPPDTTFGWEDGQPNE